MRLLTLVLSLISAFGVAAQQDYTYAEVLSFAKARVELSKHIQLIANDAPPGLDSSGMSYARYGEILSARLTGQDVQLSSNDSLALVAISEAVIRREKDLLDQVTKENGISIDRFREMDRVLETDREFALSYRQALTEISKNDRH